MDLGALVPYNNIFMLLMRRVQWQLRVPLGGQRFRSRYYYYTKTSLGTYISQQAYIYTWYTRRYIG